MKAVLMSIQPKWCELIASGKKTVEVRKTKPKLDVPFKVYIYCTQQKVNGEILLTYDKKVEGRNRGFRDEGDIPLAGKVIGEFVCDRITEYECSSKGHGELATTCGTCLTYDEIINYCNGNELYGWHISDLVIYDEPRGLGEFCVIDNEAVLKCGHRVQSYFDGYCNCGCLKCGFYCSVKDDWCDKCKTKPITRPPQSWCYVEEVNGGT